MLDRDPDVLGPQVLVGDVDDCMAKLTRTASSLLPAALFEVVDEIAQHPWTDHPPAIC
jgi:hypothetical protein